MELQYAQKGYAEARRFAVINSVFYHQASNKFKKIIEMKWDKVMDMARGMHIDIQI